MPPEGLHVQLLVDLVVPMDVPFREWLFNVVDVLNAELARQGLQESVWVIPAPPGSTLPS